MICPITREIFNRPVTTDDGFTYEEWCIRRILESNNKISPMTREKINSYHENKAMKYLVDNFLESYPNFKKDQFSSNIYTDYIQNKNHALYLLRNNKFIQFSQMKNIHLLDSYVKDSNYTIIEKICRHIEIIDIEIFKKILINSFDLNKTPLYYIAKLCPLNYIYAAINVGINIEFICNNKTLVHVIMEKDNITIESKKEFIKYLLDYGYLVKIFIKDPSCFNLSDIGCHTELLNKITENEESFYRLIDIKTLYLICEYWEYESIGKILNRILEKDISFEKLLNYYKKEKVLHLIDCIIKIYDQNLPHELLEKIKLFLDKIKYRELEIQLIDYTLKEKSIYTYSGICLDY